MDSIGRMYLVNVGLSWTEFNGFYWPSVHSQPTAEPEVRLQFLFKMHSPETSEYAVKEDCTKISNFYSVALEDCVSGKITSVI